MAGLDQRRADTALLEGWLHAKRRQINRPDCLPHQLNLAGIEERMSDRLPLNLRHQTEVRIKRPALAVQIDDQRLVQPLTECANVQRGDTGIV